MRAERLLKLWCGTEHYTGDLVHFLLGFSLVMTVPRFHAEAQDFPVRTFDCGVSNNSTADYTDVHAVLSFLLSRWKTIQATSRRHLADCFQREICACQNFGLPFSYVFA